MRTTATTLCVLLVTLGFWTGAARAQVDAVIPYTGTPPTIDGMGSDFDPVWDGLYAMSKQALVMTLFLIGAGLTKEVLKQVGVRPLLLGVLLWVIVSITVLILILESYIR